MERNSGAKQSDAVNLLTFAKDLTVEMLFHSEFKMIPRRQGESSGGVYEDTLSMLTTQCGAGLHQRREGLNAGAFINIQLQRNISKK
jgi:hypothetical protein